MPLSSVPHRRSAAAAVRSAAAAAADGAPPKRKRPNGAPVGGGGSRPRRPARPAGPPGLGGHPCSDEEGSAGGSSSGAEGEGRGGGANHGVAAAAAAAASDAGGGFRGGGGGGGGVGGPTYIEAHRGRAATSGRTVKELGLPPLPPTPPPGAPSPSPLPAVVARRTALAEVHFGRWEHLLRCGFGLLIHGVGSKAGLLEEYGRTAHARQEGLSAVVLRGYVPSLSLRAALASLVRRVLAVADGTYGRRCLDDYIDAVRGALVWKRAGGDGSSDGGGGGGGAGGSGLLVIVHNIDGPGLRDARSQAALAALAAVPGVSLLASIDHVNAGLLVPWGGGFWAYDHVETGEPYTAEAAYYVDVLKGCGGGEGTTGAGGAGGAGTGGAAGAGGVGGASVDAAVMFLKSLTPNGRGVFRVLAKLEAAARAEVIHTGPEAAAALAAASGGGGGDTPGEGAAPGGGVGAFGGGGGGGAGGTVTVSKEILYTKCRAAFVVSNPAALDGVLREMVDHEVVRVNEAAPDGLVVLLGGAAMDKVLVGIGED